MHLFYCDLDGLFMCLYEIKSGDVTKLKINELHFEQKPQNQTWLHGYMEQLGYSMNI